MFIKLFIKYLPNFLLLLAECHLDEKTFKADKGIFLEGQVIPAVKDVNIRSLHKNDPKVILESITDADGKFR